MENVFSNYIEGIDKIPNCGTAACIGGWAASLSVKLNPKQARHEKFHYISNKQMYDFLGVSEDEGLILIYEFNWPQKFRKHKQEGTMAFARQAVRRIDHFIKTKGLE